MKDSLSILVVDDDPEVLHGTARLLEKEGYVVDLATNGEEALKSVEAHHPDLLLLDRSLPGIDGLEVCRRIKRDPALAEILVIIASGSQIESNDQAEGLEAGADGYIARPIANRELLARVEAYVRIVILNRELREQAGTLQKITTAALQAENASLNLMEDAVEARRRLEATNQELRREIAEREQAEAAMRASEERYRMLFEENPVPMWLYDVETLAFLAVNETAVRQYGYTREEFLGMTLRRVCSPDDVPTLLRRIAADQTATSSICELRHRRKDGMTIHVEIFSRPLTYAGHAARLSLVTDITEKKLLEEKFLHAQRLESVGMLAAGIAHDLNNVLSPIVFAAPMLRENLVSPRDVKILDTLEQCAERGAGLVKQILGFVRTSSTEFRPTQVKHIARDVGGLIEETFPKGIEFEHQVPSNLWTVEGNATQIHQILVNLCVNARDAMPNGGRLRFKVANRRLDEVEAAAIPGARPGAWLMLEVGDTGTGIPPGLLEQIWMPFFTTKGPNRGTGLGLTTVRSIVLSHHGFIEVQTEERKGTTFRVFLPAIETNSRLTSDGAAARSPAGHGELILVVEDDANIREFVASILEKHGYRALQCADGVDGVTQFISQPEAVSLVITDVDMPRLGGLGLAQAVRRTHPGLRIIAMSGLSHSASGVSDLPSIQSLAHAILHKPFTADELLGTVHRVLQATEKI
jgi:two-component system cell cycle sensor histidine kinase/response regulator CckA